MNHKFVVRITAFLLVLIATPLLGLDSLTRPPIESIETRSIVFISWCPSGIYANLSLWIDDMHVVLHGYFCEVTVLAYIYYMISYLEDRGYSLIEAVKLIVHGYNSGEANPGINMDGWTLFLTRGGYCWGASRRAAYILSLYNITSLTVVLETDPPHTILLVPPVYGGEKIVYNNKTYTVLINYPPIELPHDITPLVKQII